MSFSYFHHTCCDVSYPWRSWLKFCLSCSSGKPAVIPLLLPVMRAVNCWLWFHWDWESARQQSKALAFKPWKWDEMPRVYLYKWNQKSVFNGAQGLKNAHHCQSNESQISDRGIISLGMTVDSHNIHFICLFSTPLHMLNSFLSVFIPLYSLQPKFWMILMMRTLDLAWWMKRRMPLLPKSLVSLTETLLEKYGSLDQCKSIKSHCFPLFSQPFFMLSLYVQKKMLSSNWFSWFFFFC